jgi:very-short-patch-repair endonuclease
MSTRDRRSPEEELFRVAARQHQLIRRDHARALGLSARMLRARLESGRLVMFRKPNVLAVPGIAPTWRQAAMGAVLAAGPTAFASHSTAARLFGLPFPDWLDTSFEVTVVLGRYAQLDGVRIHRSGMLVDRDVTHVDGIPVSSPERTIVDLSSRLSVRHLGALTDAAFGKRITTARRVQQCCDRLPRAPGRSPNTVYRMLLARFPDGSERESVLEDFVYESIRQFDLPLPRCQVAVRAGGKRYRIDMAYPEHKIAIEADGYEVHGPRAAFDRDRQRGNDVALMGYRTLHFTSADTNWSIACTVARAIDRPAPGRPEVPLTFADWCLQLTTRKSAS